MFDILDVELTQSVSNLLQVIILKVLPEEGSSLLLKGIQTHLWR